MGVLDYVEYCLSWLSHNVRGHDESLFVKGPAFTNFPSPTIELTFPDCGSSNAVFERDYTQLGAERFPELEWTDLSPETKEYLLVSEDADLPMPGLIFSHLFHGLYYTIPPRTNRVRASDFD